MTSEQSCRAHDASPYAHFPAGVLRWAVLAMICLGIVSPAQSAEKALEKKAPAAAASPEARLPNDDIAAAIYARSKASEKDNIAALVPLEGTWDYTESLWTDPKAKPEQGTGFVTNSMGLDRHYLTSHFMGSLNIGRESIPVEGQELIGFDTAKKSLSFVAVDTLTTSVTAGSGTFDEKTKVIRETGHFTNPLTGVEQDFRAELAFADADHYKRTVFVVHKSGRDTKLMESDYTKRK